MARNEGLRLDMSPLKWLSRQLGGRMLPEPLPRLWHKRYSTYVQRRFVREGAMGPPGFNRRWKRLKEATLKRRRKEGRGAKILQDLRMTYTALEPGKPGHLFKKIRGGIRVGFGGASPRPKGGTIAEIAKAHDAGIPGKLPQRLIIVPPDMKTLKGMQSDLERVIGRLGRKAGRRMRAGMRGAFSRLGR